MLAIVLAAAGCSERPAPAKPDLTTTRDLIGPHLPGAQGKEPEDQRAIDLTMAGACSAGVYDADQCREHTRASRARWQEFRRAESPPVS